MCGRVRVPGEPSVNAKTEDADLRRWVASTLFDHSTTRIAASTNMLDDSRADVSPADRAG
jgi:hypothetical protein